MKEMQEKPQMKKSAPDILANVPTAKTPNRTIKMPDKTEQDYKKINVCRCGEQPELTPGAVMGYAVKCSGCDKQTKFFGNDQHSINCWNFLVNKQRVKK